MENVANTTPYQTVQMLNVILTGRTRVVVVDGVVTRQKIALVGTVQTTSLLGIGGNQEVRRSGDTTGGVVKTTLYLMVHLVSVILTVINRVVVIDGMGYVQIIVKIGLPKVKLWSSKVKYRLTDIVTV